MADAGRSDNSNSNGSTSSSRSTSTAGTSSPAHNAGYDATDSTVSIIFGQRGRQRQRHHQHRHSRSWSSVARSSSQNSVRRSRNSDGERVPEPRASDGVESLRHLEQPERASVADTGYFNAQAPRLLRDMSAPTEAEFSDAVCQLLTGQSSYNIDSEAHMTRSVSLELLSDSGSISFTDEVDEEASTDLPLMDYEVESPVDREPGQTEGHSSDEASSTHRGAPSTVADCSGLPDSSTLAEIFRCLICLGKVGTALFPDGDAYLVTNCGIHVTHVWTNFVEGSGRSALSLLFQVGLPAMYQAVAHRPEVRMPALSISSACLTACELQVHIRDFNGGREDARETWTWCHGKAVSDT